MTRSRAGAGANVNGLGARIRDLRLRLRTERGRPPTLAQFGDLVARAEADLAGRRGAIEPYPHSTVSRWENDQRRPARPTLAAIARVGGVALETLDAVHEGRGYPPGGQDAHTEPRRPAGGDAPGLGARLVRWRQRFLLELANGGATDREVTLVAAWLALPAGDRADGHPAVAIGDARLLALWERMADAARWCLARRGRDLPSPTALPPDHAPAVRPRGGPGTLAEAVYDLQRGTYAAAAVLDALLDGDVSAEASRNGLTRRQ